jgi:YVTN family beta-propeller protein
VITGFDNPRDIKVRPDGLFVYVTNSGNGTVSVIDPSTNTIVETITGFRTPVGLTFTTDSAYAYITDTKHNAVYMLRTSDNTIQDIVLGFNDPSYIAVTPDRTYAFVSNTTNNTISVMRTSDNFIVYTIPIPVPQSLAVTQDGLYLYVGSDYGTVFKVQIVDYAILIAIPNFQNPSNITLTTNNAPADTVNGCQVTLSPTEVFNRVTWHAAPGDPISYTIYQDVDLTQLLATLSPTTYSYNHMNLQIGQTYNYYMIAEYANGFSSTIGSVEIAPVRACSN